MVDSARDAREFLLTTYRTLPNVLIVSALVLGAATGYLPLAYVGLGLLGNATIIATVQALLASLFPRWLQVVQPAARAACSPLPGVSASDSGPVIVAPSQWIGAAAFFAAFVAYDAAAVLARPAVPGAPRDRVDARVARSLSVLVVVAVFGVLVLARALSGCETVLGAFLGAGIGVGLAIGYWHLLDACGTGAPPDVLQIVANAQPPGMSADKAPVVCTP